MMEPPYVTDGSFQIIDEQTVGACGVELRVSRYRLRANPSREPTKFPIHTVIAEWGASGFPADAVYQLGDFYRVQHA